jgi:hypothetical protein
MIDINLNSIDWQEGNAQIKYLSKKMEHCNWSKNGKKVADNPITYLKSYARKPCVI